MIGMTTHSCGLEKGRAESSHGRCCRRTWGWGHGRTSGMRGWGESCEQGTVPSGGAAWDPLCPWEILWAGITGIELSKTNARVQWNPKKSWLFTPNQL